MEGYEVRGPNGERGWWDGKKITPLGENGLPMKAGVAAPKLPEPEQKRLTELKEKADKSLYAATQAEEFVRLNRKQGTGGFNALGLPFLGTIGDLRASWDPELAQMKAITSRVAPKQREPGSGSSSNLDVEMMVSGLPNINMPGNANRETQLQWQAQANYDAAKAAFLDRYSSRFGTLNGADVAFSRWWASEGKKKHGLEAMRPKSVPQISSTKYLGTE